MPPVSLSRMSVMADLLVIATCPLQAAGVSSTVVFSVAIALPARPAAYSISAAFVGPSRFGLGAERVEAKVRPVLLSGTVRERGNSRLGGAEMDHDEFIGQVQHRA